MTPPVPDVAELDAILEHIDAHPEEWFQGDWGTQTACGTAFCLAGHKLIRAGYTAEPHTAGIGARMDFFTPNGRLVDPGDEAETLLGLSISQADALFASHDTVDAMREMVNVLRDDPDNDLEDWAEA